MKLAYMILYVQDVEEAAKFYERAFGLARGFADPNGDYLALKSGETILSFAREEFVKGNGVRFSPVRADASPPGIEIGFIVDDVDAAYRRALDAGAMPWFEPKPQSWGQVVSYVRDPNGFLVEIASPPPGSS